MENYLWDLYRFLTYCCGKETLTENEINVLLDKIVIAMSYLEIDVMDSIPATLFHLQDEGILPLKEDNDEKI